MSEEVETSTPLLVEENKQDFDPSSIALLMDGYAKRFHVAQSNTEFSYEKLVKGKDWNTLNDQFKQILI